VKLAAIILVGVGTVAVVASYVLMRRRLEQLRRSREGGR
jgi:hypothetical protein